MDEKIEENRLANESSPYLRQHAHNPVNWYPWGMEAFEKARKEDKPIFLSIGYSSCHWCHVMERESFEDKDVARILNRFYVSVKVDREERPDVDSIFMTAAQMISGQGGWPLTIVMTPDKRPFFAATYLPKESHQGMLGLLDVLPTLADFWKNRRGEIETLASRVLLGLKSIPERTPGEELGTLTFDNAFQNLIESFDEHWAGFGTAPKFPTPHHLTFLLRYWKRTGEPMALFIADRTLDAMRHGGIFDQIGFGFHRYSTDRQWIVPHFEKMLYDQALLAIAYLECYQLDGKEEFARTARHIFEYVLRDLTSQQGAFYSAEDADSDGVEGKFYRWTVGEIKNILTPDESRLVLERFDIQEEGNYEEGMPGERRGDNIPHLMKEFHEPTKSEYDEALLFSAIRKMREAREKRAKPTRDEKILTDWNALMIVALSMGARILSDEGYLEAAKRCADLLIERASQPDGRVSHEINHKTSSLGFLSDNVFLAWSLLELYESAFDIKYLRRAIEIIEATIAHFWDHEGGGFFDTSDDGEKLLTRQKQAYDGAIPSGNSVATMVLFKLYLITEKEKFRECAIKTERAFSQSISAAPQNYTQFLNSVDLIIGPTYEISIVGPEGEERQRMLSTLASKFTPSKVIVVKPTEGTSEIERIAPMIENREMIDGKVTAYVCLNQTCKAPVTSPRDLLTSINAA